MVMEEDPQALALSDMRSSVLSSGDGGGNGSGNGGVSVGGVLAPGVIGGAGGGNVPGGPLVSAVVGSHSKKDAQDLAVSGLVRCERTALGRVALCTDAGGGGQNFSV